MLQTIAVANQKGGIGKTTITHTLGYLLSRRRRVLMVDADAQSSLTGSCGLADDVTPNLATVLDGTVTMTAAVHQVTEHLAIVPAGGMQLADFELTLASRPGRETTLRRALSKVSGYDLVLIDCPPGLGLATLNTLVAADGALVPVQPTAQDLRGLILFLKTIQMVTAELNPRLQIVGLVPTFYSYVISSHADALTEMRASGLPVLQTIGRSTRVAEASAGFTTIVQYEPSNTRAAEFEELGRQVERWLRK